MLTFSFDTVKTERTGTLFSSVIYTDDAFTVVPSIGAEKVSVTYCSMPTGALFGLAAVDTRKYFEVSACVSAPLPISPQPINANMNINKNADKIFIYKSLFVRPIAHTYV